MQETAEAAGPRQQKMPQRSTRTGGAEAPGTLQKEHGAVGSGSWTTCDLQKVLVQGLASSETEGVLADFAVGGGVLGHPDVALGGGVLEHPDFAVGGDPDFAVGGGLGSVTSCRLNCRYSDPSAQLPTPNSCLYAAAG